MASIARTDDAFHGQARLEGTRIGVLHVHDVAVDGDAPGDSSLRNEHPCRGEKIRVENGPNASGTRFPDGHWTSNRYLFG